MLKVSSFSAKEAAQHEQLLFGVRNLSLNALKILIWIYINIDIKLISNGGLTAVTAWISGVLDSSAVLTQLTPAPCARASAMTGKFCRAAER